MRERLRRPDTVDHRIESAHTILRTDSYRNALLNATIELSKDGMEGVAFPVVDTGRRWRTRLVPTKLYYQFGIDEWRARPLEGAPKNADILPHIVHTVLVRKPEKIEVPLPTVPPIEFFKTLKNSGFFFGFYGQMDPRTRAIEGTLYSKPYKLPEDPANEHITLLEYRSQADVDTRIHETFGSESLPTIFYGKIGVMRRVDTTWRSDDRTKRSCTGILTARY